VLEPEPRRALVAGSRADDGPRRGQKVAYWKHLQSEKDRHLSPNRPVGSSAVPGGKRARVAPAGFEQLQIYL